MAMPSEVFDAPLSPPERDIFRALSWVTSTNERMAAILRYRLSWRGDIDQTRLPSESHFSDKEFNLTDSKRLIREVTTIRGARHQRIDLNDGTDGVLRGRWEPRDMIRARDMPP